MKKIGKILALAIAAMLVLAMFVPAFATDPATGGATTTKTHTITIDNNDQNVAHTYEAYQIFSGTLDAKEEKLADIQWGSGVNGTNLLAALKATTDAALKATAAGKDALGKDIAVGDSLFKNCETADDVARVLATFTSTNGTAGVNESAGKIDAVATIIAANLGTKTADFTADSTGKKYNATVTGDGYYFIKDVTTKLQDDDTTASDTLSKYLLAVIKDTTIVAKDTGLTPNKTQGEAKVKAGTYAVGDTVPFEVTVEVPNTRKYEDHFVFNMSDQLPEGITFTGITSVTVGSKTLADKAKEATDPITSTYDGTNGYYTLKIGTSTTTETQPALTNGKYAWEADDYDAVEAAGGQKIVLVFNEFKKFVEKNDLIGKTVTINYTGVVNDDAKFDATANINEVEFKYSTDPNHDYDGDEPGPDDVIGVTPKSNTRSYTTSLKILKVDENGDPLEGATFELKGNALNRTILSGYKFVETSYTPVNGETIDTTKTYWKLNSGAYTDTDPTTVTNTTQYADTQKTYYKVTYTRDEVAAKETDIVVVTGADGIAEFIGLTEGSDYTLEEIAAPEGFNKIDGKAEITITWSDPEATGASEDLKKTGGYTLTATGTASFADAIEWNATDKQFKVTIENKSGSVLPSTGGIGTTIFYIVGGLLVVAAGVLLVTKRRVSVQK